MITVARFARGIAIVGALAALTPFANAATLITNVNGWTATATAADTHQAVESKRFGALLMDASGRVVDTGDEATLIERALTLGEPVEELDGGGRFLMPGVIDAHGHFTNLGFGALRLNVTGIRSLAETV